MRDLFAIDEPTVISFSGGRTSGYMLWRVLQANNGLPDGSYVCFANTGKENEATLEFVRDCEKNWGILIHWIEYTNEKPFFKRVTFETASRNGEPFEKLILKKKYLPNPRTRFCTQELKVLAIHRYLKSLGWKDHDTKTDWVGMRADEPRRAAKIEDKTRIPLFMAGVTKQTVIDFWKNQLFDLKLPNIDGITALGNCDLCFLKGKRQVMSLIEEKPDRAIWWAKMEKIVQNLHPNYDSTGAVFRFDRNSYAEMAANAIRETNLPLAIDGDDDETIVCFCGD